MSKPSPIVDANGDISVHRSEGAIITVTVPGVTAGQLSFLIQGQVAIGATATGVQDQYQIAIPQTVVNCLPAVGTLFALRVSGGPVPLIYWEGTITPRGFAG